MIGNVRRKVGVVQNLGWFDRLLRVGLGALLIAVPAYQLFIDGSESAWPYYLMLLSVYPVLTGALGWDPAYAGLKIKTCDTSEVNQCGSFPYEVDAALGRQPIPRSDYDRRLENSDHEKPYEIE